MSDCLNGLYILLFFSVPALFVLYTMTIVRVIKGSKYRFLKQVIALLMISNLGVLTTVFSSIYLCRNQKSTFWTYVFWLSTGAYYGFYGVAHWILASKYNQIASEIPYLLYDTTVPAS